MKKQSLALLLFLFSANSFALSINLKIHLEGTDTYHASGSELTGNTSKVGGIVSIYVEDNGQVQSAQQAIPSDIGPNTTTIAVLNKNTVQLSDYTQGVNAMVPAKIKSKAFSGKVKSLVIKGDDYLAAYKEVLEKQGLGMLQSLQISTSELTLSTKLVASDYKCISEDTLVNCKSSIDVIITAND